MTNKAHYHAMMDQVRAPERVLGRAKDITMEKTKRAPLALKYATVTMVALLSVFAVTNGVCYAATGETWVQHFTTTIDGQPVDITVKATDAENERVGEVIVTAKSNGERVELGGDEAVGDVASSESVGFYVSTATDGGEAVVVEGEDGTVSLVIGSSEPVDITEDIADGRAEGTVTVDGDTVGYTVTGTSGAYEVQLS